MEKRQLLSQVELSINRQTNHTLQSFVALKDPPYAYLIVHQQSKITLWEIMQRLQKGKPFK